MVDLFDTLVQFLCYGNQNCFSLAQQYAYKPMEGLFYFIFFPAVFIILFIYMLTMKLMPGHRGFRILLSVAFFAFIILQGWYHHFVILGKFWYIALIILGFFWLALHSLRGGIGGGGGGGGAKGRSAAGGILAQALHAAKDRASGVTTTQLGLLEGKIQTLASTPRGGHGVDELTREIDELFMQIRQDLPRYYMNRKQFNELRQEYLRICRGKGANVGRIEKEVAKAA